MGQCETCGNDYDKTMEIRVQGSAHVFDSFECAIEALAPRCAACGVRIVGHGVEAGSSMFCCAHCASKHGAKGARDRVSA